MADQEPLRAMIRELLEEQGYTVLEAEAGQAALERPECRALYMSGYSDGAISDRGMLLEGAALLEKPFTSDRLGISVREALATPPSGPLGSDE